MAIGLNFAARSDIGLGRYKNNQDSGYAGPSLLAVADGMGGAAGGDVASSTVVDALAPLDTGRAGDDPVRDLAAAIAAANTAMRKRARAEAFLDGMGSTCTALRRVGSRLILAHVGDSRAYVLADGTLRQVTHDHTFVQRLVDTGQITEEEAERHPQRSVILRVVGHLDDDDDIDTASFGAAVGQRWLLCSDGLPRVVSAGAIRDTLAQDTTVAQAAERLVELALDAGGPDNITVVVADVVDNVEDPPAGAPQIVGAAALPAVAAAAPPRHTTAMPAAAMSDTSPAEPASHVSDDENIGQDQTNQPAMATAPDPEDNEPHRPRWITNALVALVILAVLGASLIGLRTWSRTQYYVGIDGGNVAIFRGLNESLGPLNQPTLHQRTALPVATLPAVNRDRLGGGLEPASLAAAERTVQQLWKSSSLCTATTSSTDATAPGATAGPGDSSNPTPGVPGAPVPISPEANSFANRSPATTTTASGATPSASDTAAAPSSPPLRPLECDP